MNVERAKTDGNLISHHVILCLSLLFAQRLLQQRTLWDRGVTEAAAQPPTSSWLFSSPLAPPGGDLTRPGAGLLSNPYASASATSLFSNGGDRLFGLESPAGGVSIGAGAAEAGGASATPPWLTQDWNPLGQRTPSQNALLMQESSPAAVLTPRGGGFQQQQGSAFGASPASGQAQQMPWEVSSAAAAASGQPQGGPSFLFGGLPLDAGAGRGAGAGAGDGFSAGYLAGLQAAQQQQATSSSAASAAGLWGAQAATAPHVPQPSWSTAAGVGAGAPGGAAGNGGAFGGGSAALFGAAGIAAAGAPPRYMPGAANSYSAQQQQQLSAGDANVESLLAMLTGAGL